MAYLDALGATPEQIDRERPRASRAGARLKAAPRYIAAVPTPVRDDGSPGPTRRLLMLVHGFNSAAATWTPLRDQLRADDSIGAEFDLQSFSYETALAAVPVIRRLPTLDEAGKSLAAAARRPS